MHYSYFSVLWLSIINTITHDGTREAKFESPKFKLHRQSLIYFGAFLLKSVVGQCNIKYTLLEGWISTLSRGLKPFSSCYDPQQNREGTLVLIVLVFRLSTVTLANSL